jgi:hypothetical protein
MRATQPSLLYTSSCSSALSRTGEILRLAFTDEGFQILPAGLWPGGYLSL